MNMKKNENAITLIALVITIIVLLILAGISLSMLSGNNGLLSKASQAKERTGTAQYEERIGLAYSAAILEKINNGFVGDINDITKEDLKNALEKEGIIVKADKITSDDDTKVITIDLGTNGKYTIDSDGKASYVDGTYTGGTASDNQENIQGTPTTETESYVGYYADIDGDGTPDGIIYADLAKGNTGDGQWTDSDGNYSIPQITSGLKEYIVSAENASTKVDGKGFDDNKVITAKPGTTGTDRFYVMAVQDFTITDVEADGKSTSLFDWYSSAYGQMSDYDTYTSGDFATGKENTRKMIEKWNAKGYGEQDKCSSHKDIWGLINDEYTNGWFIPSRAEWSAFADQLEISKKSTDTKYYVNFGLSNYYWSSSQGDTYSAYDADFYDGYILDGNVNGYTYVRLSTTF